MPPLVSREALRWALIVAGWVTLALAVLLFVLAMLAARRGRETAEHWCERLGGCAIGAALTCFANFWALARTGQ
jgi:hypothetical protein